MPSHAPARFDPNSIINFSTAASAPVSVGTYARIGVSASRWVVNKNWFAMHQAWRRAHRKAGRRDADSSFDCSRLVVQAERWRLSDFQLNKGQVGHVRAVPITARLNSRLLGGNPQRAISSDRDFSYIWPCESAGIANSLT
jgi:hypothetical protein